MGHTRKWIGGKVEGFCNVRLIMDIISDADDRKFNFREFGGLFATCDSWYMDHPMSRAGYFLSLENNG